MPTTGIVKLHFSVVDHHLGIPGGERQVILKPKVWKEEFQGLLDVVLEKGCYELHVQGGATLIGLYPSGAEFEDIRASDVSVRRRRQGKSLFGKARLGPFMEFMNRVCAPPIQNLKPQTPGGKRGTHSPISLIHNTKPIKVSIHSDMLLRNPFLEWTITMLNSRASTIGILSVKLSDLPEEIWKMFLDGITLPQLFDFEITGDLMVPFHGFRFADLHSFLHRHPSIETLHLYGVEIPKGVWPPPSLRISILPRLKSIIAHPFYVVWILNGLLMARKTCGSLTDIGISSEYSRNPSTFDYTLFDRALQCVAAFPAGQIRLMLRFASNNDGDMNDWIEKQLATKNDPSKSNIVSRLENVTSLVVSTFWIIDYDWKSMDMLPDWLAMFPNLREIEFTDQAQENVQKLEEFVRKVAMACPKAESLDLRRRRLCLDKVRGELKIQMNADGGVGSGKGVSA
ncbi:hypothetical protein M413DRAFT_445290 [Hebeloma cylindrosporum]|uniref:Uncharacterized protein n=1 Tax=Hebeloma cylindrosporum TaxID=76867 RepID=A0A0C3CCC2_HEBCY|nr:hypothetical protein M413DRAFT_445290 [Hebeloma cylindrosporum h7]